jgi:hypothetical protein
VPFYAYMYGLVAALRNGPFRLAVDVGDLVVALADLGFVHDGQAVARFVVQNALVTGPLE